MKELIKIEKTTNVSPKAKVRIRATDVKTGRKMFLIYENITDITVSFEKDEILEKSNFKELFLAPNGNSIQY